MDTHTCSHPTHTQSTHTQKHRHTPTSTHTKTHPHTPTSTHTHKRTHTYPQVHTHTRAHPHRHTHPEAHPHIQAPSHTWTLPIQNRLSGDQPLPWLLHTLMWNNTKSSTYGRLWIKIESFHMIIIIGTTNALVSPKHSTILKVWLTCSPKNPDTFEAGSQRLCQEHNSSIIVFFAVGVT